MVGKVLNGISIEDMKVEDLPEVLAIETASFTTPWSEVLFRNEIFKTIAVSHVARKDRVVVGYLCANIVLDEGHILNLSVHPEYRRSAIASLLIRDMIEVMKDNNCRSIFLEVRASNERARVMYEKSGFALLGTRKNYYVSPVEDAVVMVLRM